MKLNEINIRDPFVLEESGVYFLYGTRAANFGIGTGGFDVYTSENLEDWSNARECFNSVQYGLNTQANWAPEIHKYLGAYYMFATFTKPNGLRGVYVLIADNPLGPFKPHSETSVTPEEWECLDGTLYISQKGEPYLVFCHEHTQITDGTICYLKLDKDLKRAQGNAEYMFSGSAPYWADNKPKGYHYVTDGPFMYRTSGGTLLMIWSTSVNGKYAQCIAESSNGEIDGEFIHLPLLFENDGGHGMIFNANGKLMLALHTPNQTLSERPIFKELNDNGNTVTIK